MKSTNRLCPIDAETLMDTRLPQAKQVVDTLLPQGVSILGGAPKLGKSWLALALCLSVAQGVPFWGFATTQGTVLYLCLEDTERRIQSRLSVLSEETPPNLFFSTSSRTLADGLCGELAEFVRQHPDTALIVIDTFQMIRRPERDISYAGDYQEIQQLKALADQLHLSVLLVHHLRKMGDNDPLNRLSGTTGIAGAVDAVFVLTQTRRGEQFALLTCTGRDIESREIELCFEKESCRWVVETDSFIPQPKTLPPPMEQLLSFMEQEGNFVGSNTELAERFNTFSGASLTPKALKQMMNRWRYLLEDRGLRFENRRSNGTRVVVLCLDRDASDANSVVVKTCDPCVPA